MKCADIANRARASNTEVCALFSLIFVRFNLSPISLYLSQLVIYYFPSILVSCMHQRDIRSLHDAVSCDVTLVHHPPSCIRHTKFFSLIVTVLPLFPTALYFSSFIKQQVYKRYAAYHGRYYVAREVISARYVTDSFFMHIYD